MAGRRQMVPNQVVGNPNPRGRKSKENETKSKSGETKSKAIFLPPIQPFQRLKLRIQGSRPSYRRQQINEAAKSNRASPALSARWRPSPTTAGSIARLSDYRKLFSLFLVLARILAALGSKPNRRMAASRKLRTFHYADCRRRE
jgi:hypothetical protein